MIQYSERELHSVHVIFPGNNFLQKEEKEEQTVWIEEKYQVRAKMPYRGFAAQTSTPYLRVTSTCDRMLFKVGVKKGSTIWLN